MLHRPQSLISPFGSTTSIVRAEPPATRTWCFTARKALCLRPEAPCLSAGPSLRRPGRGASPSANPCSSVRRHHVLRPERTLLRVDVVPHPPQTLGPPSGGTTSSGPNGLSPGSTWCLTLRKPLFLRPEAPRPQARTDFPPAGRGASPSANPCPSVQRHHVPGLSFSYKEENATNIYNITRY